MTHVAPRCSETIMFPLLGLGRLAVIFMTSPSFTVKLELPPTPVLPLTPPIVRETGTDDVPCAPLLYSYALRPEPEL